MNSLYLKIKSISLNIVGKIRMLAMRHGKAVITESRKISSHLSKDRIVVIIVDFLPALSER